MFNFFRRSKKDESNGSKRKKENGKDKESREIDRADDNDKKKMCKNNQPSTPELASKTDAIPLPKNAVNASETSTGEVVTFQKNFELETKMCDANALKAPESPNRTNERRGSVKPCGHGTTAITPWVPVVSSKRENTSTPPGSPVQDKKRNFIINKREHIVTTPPSSPEIKNKKPFLTNGCDNSVNTPPSSPEDDLKKQLNDVVDESKKVDDAEIVELSAGPAVSVNVHLPLENGYESGEEKKNLINQEAKFQSQLNDLSKQLTVRDAEANKLRFQMEELQRDVFAKSAGMDRLQAELNAATKESDIVRHRIRHLESELENYRIRNSDLNEELQNKTDAYNEHERETKEKIIELEGVVKNLRERIESLEEQLNELKEEKDKIQERYTELSSERDEERRKLVETLETASKQKQEIEAKWKEDFEKLRTVNIVKEQELLDDFEWKLREVQQSCKKRLEDKDKEIKEKLQQAYEEAQSKMKEAEEKLDQVETLKTYEQEVETLRGITTNQEKALQELKDQQEQMKQAEASLQSETKRLLNLIQLEKENLQFMQRVHHQEILDKERKLKETLNQKRTEIAMYWEERLHHECGRLKDELEQIHNEEKYFAMEAVRKEKDEEFQQKQLEWESKLKMCLKEIASLKQSLDEKDDYYHEELERVRSNTDRDIIELRRLMDKIDMKHHENYEKLMADHEIELENINKDHEDQLKQVETQWESQVGSLRSTLELVKDQMERESQQKIESLIQQHRTELDTQWGNLIHQKEEGIKLIEDEYVNKYKTLEEQFYTQQKSHENREIELLKTIDTLKNELGSKESTIDDLQNNVDTLEGGVQVLRQEIAQQGDDINKVKRESEQKIRCLHETVANLLEEREKEREAVRLKMMGNQKQAQETIDHLQRKCQCLTKLFEEVRQRYERRESRQEDLNKISDLKQVIAEQEKDLTCINEEKRYFQMRLMQLERHLDQQQSSMEEDDDYEDAQSPRSNESSSQPPIFPHPNVPVSIPPTIPECDDYEE